MTQFPKMERGERESSPTDSVISVNCDESLDIKRYASNNQLTISTLISFGEFDIRKQKEAEKSVGKVESLYNEKIQNEEKNEVAIKHEKWYSVTLQVFIPFMLAGMGTIGAGLVQGNFDNYPVFRNISALYILAPGLTGLKGNLDMCLASRLSTQCNLGNMKCRKEITKMIIGNISLVQVQAIIAANIAALFAVSVSAIKNGEFFWQDALLLSCATVLTATISCFTLDFLLIAVIFLSRKLKLNPDNVATPLAASIGDVVSLMVLSTSASLLYEIHDTHTIVLIGIVLTYLLVFLPFWVFIVIRNEYTRPILTSGWTPVLVALAISSTGGLVLDEAVGEFSGFEVFSPIINGIGGNLVSVQASRISTMLHQTSIRGVIPPHTKQWVAPWTALIKGVLPAKTARILIMMAVPGHIVYVFLVDLLYNKGISTLEPIFVITYLSVGLIQIMCLLYIAHIMIHIMWRLGHDPDSGAIPYLTALGDLFGSTLLLLAFIFLRSVNHEYSPIEQT